MSPRPPVRKPSFAILLLGTLAVGCAVHPAQDRGTVSDEVRRRTGHGLRPSAARQILPEGISLADGLTEDEAVAVALWRNPDLEVALAELGLSRADLVEAGLLRNPVFSILFPLGPKQLEFTLTWPIEALWQRPRRVAAARSDLARTAERLVLSGLDLVRDVRLAHAAVLLAEDRARLTQESQEVRARIAAIAEVQLRVGEVSPLEAAAVQAEAAKARDEAQSASRAVEASRDRLLAILGGPGDAPRDALALAPPAPCPVSVPELDALLREAFAARPELRAVEIAMEAAGRRAGVARSEVLTLSAILDANGEGKGGFEMGPGLALEVPLFGRHEGRLARAEAELELEARRYAATRARIDLEVRQARTALVGARESVAVWEGTVLPMLEANLARQEKALEAGDASLLEVLAARRSALDARIHQAEARAAERRAAAELAHGIGRALDAAPQAPTSPEAFP